MQGGDPSGTGRGGESIWGNKFADEPDSRLVNDMAYYLTTCNEI